MGSLKIKLAVLFPGLWFLGLAMPAIAQQRAEIVRMMSYHNGTETRVLTLWRQDIQPLAGPELLNYFSSHPDRTSFPNTAFMVVDSPVNDQSKGRIVWLTFVFHDKQIRPQQNWEADLARPASADRAYVVLAKSTGWQVNLAAYSMDPHKAIAAFPIALNPQDYSQWPSPSGPLSQMDTTLVGKEVSGISDVNVVSQRDELLIFLEREHKDVSPAAFRFNLSTKEWSELVVQPKAPEPRAPRQ